MKKIGLTGGIGSGKTYIANIFIKLGIPVFNSDLYAKKLMNQNHDLIESLKQEFGNDIYINGKINKNKMSDIIFKSTSALNIIYDIVHPFVNKEFESWFKNQNSNYVLKEAAILFETGNNKLMDLNVLVYASLDKRISRVIKRDNKNREQIINIINTQVCFDEVKLLSDYIIYNDDKDFLLPQIMKIHNNIIKYN